MNYQIETHNFCNFTCGYCPNKDMERKRQFMDSDVWLKIINDYVLPYRYVNAFCPPTVILHKDSEPLIDKKLPSKLLDIAAVAPDVKIDIYSNGVLLPSWRDRGCDFMEFLASLPNKVRYLMSYHPFNYDNSVNDYAKTIEYMRDVLCNPPSNVEFITVSHKSRWVSEEMQVAWRRVWEGLPITVHCNCSINPWTGRIESDVKFNGCPYADFSHWFFGVTGNIIVCCLDLEEEIVLGNVLENNPEEMFQRTNDFYARQRVILENKEQVDHPVCANCFGQTRNDLIQLGVST